MYNIINYRAVTWCDCEGDKYGDSTSIGGDHEFVITWYILYFPFFIFITFLRLFLHSLVKGI